MQNDKPLAILFGSIHFAIRIGNECFAILRPQFVWTSTLFTNFVCVDVRESIWKNASSIIVSNGHLNSKANIVKQ